ncbi:hypothetical protein DSM03_1011216 [Leeuwenhoekiella aestuarii]|uniref:Uncharacterized protein n=1 Tax=Leeuwenhoekiella aestuarii TaxID=2249426 RepID=A0A4Q0P0V1_9FLAO|nr:hypothetical protein DSM04_101727 [Leeuwenhoekiella aestuarii]RXG19830.1 hypothetical protein DSM03_1011216 [Leeuwenhoekiella aestuarii]
MTDEDEPTVTGAQAVIILSSNCHQKISDDKKKI